MKKMVAVALLLVLTGMISGCYVGPAHRRHPARGGVIVVP